MVLVTNMIVSERRFGVEIEMGFPTETDISNARDELAHEFRTERDGSLTCKNPVEVISPILSGSKGARKIRRACEVLQENNGNAGHVSCGMHVHIDAPEFKEEYKIKIIDDEKEFLWNNPGVRYCKITEKDLLAFSGFGGGDLDSVMRKIMRYGMEITNPFQHRSNPESNAHVRVFYRLGDAIESKVLSRDDYDAGSMRFAFGTEEHYNYLLACKDRTTAKKKILFYEQNDLAATEKLKNALLFYVVFNDVFTNMVPNNRKKGNTYCIPVSESFEVDEILACRTMLDVQKLWYRVQSQSEVDRCKRDRYQDSRYHDVNLHSLWYRNGTIEIRSHGGTLDYRKILLWTSLHQSVVDKIASSSISQEQIVESGAINDLAEKTIRMINMLGLTPLQEKYVRRTVNHFAVLKYPL